MRAGQLRFLIIAEEPIETKGTLSDVEQTWTFRGKFRANITSIRGQERFSLMQQKSTADSVIETRGNSAPYLTTKMRLVHVDRKGRTEYLPGVMARVFDIEAIIDVNNRGIKKEIYCKEAA